MDKYKVQKFSLKQIAENLDKIPRNGVFNDDTPKLTKEQKRKLMDMGQVPLAYGPAETAAFMRAESTKYKTLIERTGIRIDSQ